MKRGHLFAGHIKQYLALCLLAACLFSASPLSTSCATPSFSGELVESEKSTVWNHPVPLYEGLEGCGLCIDPALQCPAEPRTAEDFQDVLAYMALYDLDALNLTYHDMPPEDFLAELRRMSSDELHTYRYTHPEYFNYMNLVYLKEVTPEEGGVYGLGIRLFAHGYDNATMIAYRHQAFWDARKILRSLYDTGKLRPGMRERSRAKVITKWIIDHTEYDDDETRLCHTGWSVFQRGTAVCDGYVSALQLMLSLDGIQCRGQLGTVQGDETLHLWTIAVLDGKEVGIDPVGCEKSFRYFGMDWSKMTKWYVLKGQAS